MWWSLSTPTFPIIRFPRDSLRLEVRKGDSRTETETSTLQELLQSRCKSLFSPYRPTWWLFNGHAQTLFCVLGDFSTTDQVWYYRQHVLLSDGGTLGLDFVPHTNFTGDDDTPIIVVQHGLTGGSHEPYVRAILAPACAPVAKGGLGYRAVVINFRGCSGVPITSPKFYTAGHTDDLRQALMFLAAKYPRAPLLGLGFSIGANIMTRYLAEEGSQSLLSSACVVACPWDLAKSTVRMFESLMGRQVYLKGMGSNVRALIKHHYKPLALEKPDHPIAAAVHRFLAVKNPTIADFDDTLTRFVGGDPPTFPFPSLLSYYSWASSGHVVQDIQVPFLAINSSDDPCCSYVPFNHGGNKFVVTALTNKGGHLGWFETSRKRWSTRPVLEWLQLVGRDLVHDETRRDCLSLHTDDAGYVRMAGEDKLGCKAAGKGGIINGNRPERNLFQGL
ncbi:Alpha/Beta hydrolase protein [Mycena alexandri]|uniref:Alpha/Beta hydrolase protein n=1 Tax=Mycena alexandri TaxID=1745969 RepID=A0AAD6WP04_9AGAR|nr:Alpha/Beta hydrolase protein [Mycena alexandri]